MSFNFVSNLLGDFIIKMIEICIEKYHFIIFTIVIRATGGVPTKYDLQFLKAAYTRQIPRGCHKAFRFQVRGRHIFKEFKYTVSLALWGRLYIIVATSGVRE